MKHHSGGFSSERWRSVGGDFQPWSSQSGQRCLNTIAQPLRPPAASVETPHGFDRPPLYTRLGKGTRRRVCSSLSCDLSKARAIHFLTKKKKPEPEVTQVLERAREYGSELIVFSFFSFFLKESTHAMKDMDVFSSSCGKFCFYSLFLPVGSYVKRGWHHPEARDLSVRRSQHPLAGVLD